MSKDFSSEPHESHENNESSKYALPFDTDPALAELVGAVRENQDMSFLYDDETMDRSLELLNVSLKMNGWLADVATIRGKVRIAPWLEQDEVEIVEADPFVTQQTITRARDEKGEYMLLDGHQLSVALINIDTNDTEAARYVFTFRTRDSITNYEGDAHELEYILDSAGDFIMYPEDIIDLQFKQLSDRQIERLLRREHPDILAKMNESIDLNSGCEGGRMQAGLAAVNTYFIDAIMSDQMRKCAGRYMYSRLNPDTETLYEFRLRGATKGLREDDTLEAAEESIETSLRGKIVAIDVGGEQAGLGYVIAELSPQGEGWEVSVAPVENVTKVRNPRSQRRKYGNAIMQVFNSPEDAAAHWHERMSERKIIDDVQNLFDELNIEFPQ